jgi:hypothetical protein
MPTLLLLDQLFMGPPETRHVSSPLEHTTARASIFSVQMMAGFS